MILQILDDINFDTLPYNWTSFDLKSFSKNKTLWDFQEEAVKNAIKLLWKYYEDFGENKQKLFELYKTNGLNIDIDIKLNKINRKITELLLKYYTPENGTIPYWNFINRMSFWMATGSGKTLVIVKLIQILIELMKRGEIPKYDILFLTHRDDLIKQFERHVYEANSYSDVKIKLFELKEYENVKRQPLIFEFPVFYYRSDNISDEQKEKIIDFRNYDNNGRWYIFLDEAHKGDKEDSKRQHIYSIISRNGFLFNFSATFTDERDIITCAYEFNLSSFIKEGYGKHILVLKQEVRAFRDDKEDYNDEEKQKIALKALVLLTYVKKFYEKIRQHGALYHNPLLLVLVNSVNQEDSDLKMFFEQIEKIGKGKVANSLLQSAINELWDELEGRPRFMFEDEEVKVDENELKKITLNDILKYVFNSNSPGDIEISYRPSDKKQVAFKLTTSDKHFALSKTGDMPNWLKKELSRFNVNHRFEEEGFFERINQEDSPINILMGSRAFYEGWDSNRPNVIMFINIGTGTDAKKFVLQSVGRGVRIEPIPNKRKRALELYNNKEIDGNLYNQIKNYIQPLETLFIFGTRREALKTVIENLESEKKEDFHKISLYVNEYVKDYLLLIPVYKTSEQPLIEKRKLAKFEISEEEFELLKEYFKYVYDDRIILMNYETRPKTIKEARRILQCKNPDEYFKLKGKAIKNLDLLVQKFLNYLEVKGEEFSDFKPLGDEIKHFENIIVYLKDIKNICELTQKIENVRKYPKKERELEKLGDEKLIKELKEKLRKDEYEFDRKKIQIKYIANHYYIPLILSLDEKIEFIKHIIKTKSEVDFINHLENYLSQSNNKFKEFDWWAFSKIDEHLDDVYIPYYHPEKNSIAKFKPDFIFWLQKGNNYYIVFIDPKGYKHTEYEYKVDGYKLLFEETDGQKKVFPYNTYEVKVYLFLRTDDKNRLSKGYEDYWFDNIEQVLSELK